MTILKKKTSNPGYTTLKSMGRSHRNEPFHLVYPIRLYAKREKVNAELLNDWCGVRYLGSRKKSGTRWRIETYLHSDGKRYVHRVFFEGISDDEMMELVMKFGHFVKEKVVRDGRLRRPRLSHDEKEMRDAWLNQFYAEVSARRRAAAAEMSGG